MQGLQVSAPLHHPPPPPPKNPLPGPCLRCLALACSMVRSGQPGTIMIHLSGSLNRARQVAEGAKQAPPNVYDP